jgi:hypothetical protein
LVNESLTDGVGLTVGILNRTRPELDKLIDALQVLRKQLQNTGIRIQRDIAECAELSQQIAQLTAGVQKFPRGTYR